MVGEQVCNIIEKRIKDDLPTRVDELVDCFLEEHGFLLRPDLCGANSMEDLICNKLDSFIKVCTNGLIYKSVSF